MTENSETIPDAPGTDHDWESRKLCSDESCIGVIGADGRCRVCGLLDPNAAETPEQFSSRKSESVEPPHAAHSEDQTSKTPDAGWEDRKLCRDDSCIGTIGTDGRCRVCGLTE